MRPLVIFQAPGIVLLESRRLMINPTHHNMSLLQEMKRIFFVAKEPICQMERMKATREWTYIHTSHADDEWTASINILLQLGHGYLRTVPTIRKMPNYPNVVRNQSEEILPNCQREATTWHSRNNQNS